MLVNYEYVQRGFRILHPFMAKYIEQEFKRVYGKYWWKHILNALDNAYNLPVNGTDEQLINSLDIMNCLKLIERRWNEVFRVKLSIDYKTWAKELLGVRHKVAHIGGQDFTQNYAERELDTMALLCGAFDANGAEEIRKIYRILRYGSENGSLASPENSNINSKKKEKRNEGVMTKEFGDRLPSWRNIMQPHPDVAEGRYQTAEFAADLAQVSRGEGAVEYRDPIEFFSRTYMTEGMTGLLVESLQRLSGQGGEPVIQLKTAFGGGKTHSMLALYHMVKSGVSIDRIPSLKPILDKAGLDRLPEANVAVLVGTALDPTHGKRPGNLPKYSVNTIWGEMAYQLVTSAGKPELYGIISDSDRRGVSPGSEALKNLLDACGPCLILMDELVAYAKKIYGVDGLPAGSYDNFITFIQELTEAARASKNSIVVASIPESDIEIGGEAGKMALETIEHTFGRMESIWKPVAANEGFEVVRRRLFLDCKNPQERDLVCSAFSKMYQDNAIDFPIEAKELEYKERMISCYPIHPEVFDRLYDDWATLERFQRTRGVLRLMAAVIHELWTSNDSSAMIMPGSIPLNTSNIRDELVRYLPETWNSIIDREVDGKDSIPYQLDNSTLRYGQKLAVRRTARTIMLGSAPSTSVLRDQTLRGLEAQRIRLGIIQPGESIADFNDALNTLRNSLSYLYQNNNRYWYDTKPTLRKTAEDRALQVSEEEVTLEIEKRLKKLHNEKPFSGLHICPTSSGDIPDEQGVRLVILRPEYTFKRVNGKNAGKANDIVTNYLNTRGSSPRVYRNMLAFVAPDQDKLVDLQKEVRRYEAWDSIVSEKEKLNLDGGQIREAEDNKKRYDTIVDLKLKEAYCWLLIPYIDQYEDLKTIQWEINNLGGGNENIITKVKNNMIQNEYIITDWAPVLLKMCLDELLWKESNDIEVKKLWDYLCTYCYLPRLANYQVLEGAIKKGTQSKEFFGIAASYSDNRYTDLKLDEAIPFINKSDLLVKPSVASKQIEEEKNQSKQPPVTPPSGGSKNIGGSTGSVISSVPPSPPTPPKKIEEEVEPKKTRFYMSADLDNTRVNKNIRDYLDEVIHYLSTVDGANIKMTLEVSASVPDGFPSSTVRTVSENCNTLKIHTFGFEED